MQLILGMLLDGTALHDQSEHINLKHDGTVRGTRKYTKHAKVQKDTVMYTGYTRDPKTHKVHKSTQRHTLYTKADECTYSAQST